MSHCASTPKTRRRHTYAVAALLLSLSLVHIQLTGCAKGCGDSAGDDVVAIVNGDEILASELRVNMEILGGTYPTPEDEFKSRRAMVDTLVLQQLLVQEGYKRKYDQNEEVARVALANKEKFLLDVLFEKEIGATPEVTREEMQELYNQIEFQYHAQHILLKSREDAIVYLDSLKNGAPFGRLAADYSQDPSAKTNQGDIGTFTYGQMVGGFQDAVLTMNVGEVSQPVKSRFGWHIIKLVEKTPNYARRVMDSMRAELKQRIISRRNAEKAQAFFEKIREKYPVKIEKPTVDFLLRKREDLYPPYLLPSLPKNDFDIKQLDADDQKLPLATWDGGQINLGDYLGAIVRVNHAILPDFDNTDSLAKIIFQLRSAEILSLEARRQGLEDSDEFKKKLKRFRELTMAEMSRDTVAQPLPPDEPILRAYYDAHIQDFTQAEQMNIIECLVSDYNQAKSLRKGAKGVNQFREVAAELTERPGARAKGSGDLGWVEERWYSEIFQSAKSLGVGSFGGPVQTLGKWSVFYIVDRRVAEVKDFEVVRGRVNQIITDSLKRENFLAWADKTRQAADVTFYDDAVRNSIDFTLYADSLVGK